VAAVKQQFINRKLIAVMELHTFSSLSKDFLHEYKQSMAAADIAIVYYSPEVVALKKLVSITEEDIRKGFEREDILIFTKKAALQEYLLAQSWILQNLLLMSSGNFDGMNIQELANQILVTA
jgi:UDP-N-acetylmuramate: L-alanyl-gamma-D-glutamyl-meso-diaminopimelate ligase